MSLNVYHRFCKLRLNRLNPPSSCHLTECNHSPQNPQTDLFQPNISLNPLAWIPHAFMPHLVGMPNVIQHLHIHSSLSIAYSLFFCISGCPKLRSGCCHLLLFAGMHSSLRMSAILRSSEAFRLGAMNWSIVLSNWRFLHIVVAK